MRLEVSSSPDGARARRRRPADAPGARQPRRERDPPLAAGRRRPASAPRSIPSTRGIEVTDDGPGIPRRRGRARLRALLPLRPRPLAPTRAAPGSAWRSRAGSSSSTAARSAPTRRAHEDAGWWWSCPGRWSSARSQSGRSASVLDASLAARAPADVDAALGSAARGAREADRDPVARHGRVPPRQQRRRTRRISRSAATSGPNAALGGAGDLWGFVLARVAIDYRRELTPGRRRRASSRAGSCASGTRASRSREEIRTASGELSAEAEAVLVGRDSETGRSRPLTRGRARGVRACSRASLSPLRLGPVELQNRIVSTAHQTTLVHDHLPTDDFVAYHEARARGGAGLIVLEATAPHPSGILTAARARRATCRRWSTAYRRVGEAVQPHGTRLFVQLLHGGREQISGPPRAPALAPSAIPSQRFRVEPRALREDEIEEIVAGFGEAAGARGGGRARRRRDLGRAPLPRRAVLRPRSSIVATTSGREPAPIPARGRPGGARCGPGALRSACGSPPTPSRRSGSRRSCATRSTT